jgi:hypothetical protein
MLVLRFMNPQISQIEQIKGGTQSFFVGCVLRCTEFERMRTKTVRIAINYVPVTVRSGAPSAPYTSTAIDTSNPRPQGHPC